MMIKYNLSRLIKYISHAIVLSFFTVFLTNASAQLTQLPSAGNTAASRYVPLNRPCRVVDTRPSTGFNNYTRFNSGTGAVVRATIASKCGISSSATSVALNVTVVAATGGGHLRAYPTGVSRPSTSVVNYVAGESRASSALLKLGSSGRLDFYLSRKEAHIIIDVAGGFIRDSRSRQGRYEPIHPRRISAGRIIQAGTSSLFTLPTWVDDATAAMINVTAVSNAGRANYLTAYAPSAGRPSTSFLNVSPSAPPTAGSTIVRVTNRQFRIYSKETQKVIVDFFGYFTGASRPDTSAGLFVGINPIRVVNRARVNDRGTGETLDLNARAYAVNWAIRPATSTSYLTTYAARATFPGTSTVNGKPGRWSANGSIDRGSRSGVAYYGGLASDVFGDFTGYFIGAPVVNGSGGPRPNKPPYQLLQPASGPNVGIVSCTTSSCSSHRGYDISNKAGDLWYAAAAGVVSKTHKACLNRVKSPSPCGGSGNMVQITHDNGYLTEYYHADEGPGNVVVNVGQRVNAGQLIARAGFSGHASSYHLHFEVWDRNWTRQPASRLRWNAGNTPTKTVNGVTYRLLNLNDVDPANWRSGTVFLP